MKENIIKNILTLLNLERNLGKPLRIKSIVIVLDKEDNVYFAYNPFSKFKYFLPGGDIKINEESIIDGAKREVKEEIGIDIYNVEIVAGPLLYLFPLSVKKHKYAGEVGIILKGYTDGKKRYASEYDLAKFNIAEGIEKLKESLNDPESIFEITYSSDYFSREAIKILHNMKNTIANTKEQKSNTKFPKYRYGTVNLFQYIVKYKIHKDLNDNVLNDAVIWIKSTYEDILDNIIKNLIEKTYDFRRLTPGFIKETIKPVYISFYSEDPNKFVLTLYALSNNNEQKAIFVKIVSKEIKDIFTV